MPNNVVLTRQLVIILSVWVFVGGMAAADLFDLTDDLLQPLMSFTQVIEPELDEFDDDGVLAVVTLLARQGHMRLHQGVGGFVGSVPSPAGASARPLYQQLAQYRI